jgi:NAD(P)H dehydrogenase (quinone)
VIEAVVAALKVAKPARVLWLSTIGADAAHDNLLSQRAMLEKALSMLPTPVTSLRPGWFLENASWDVASAHATGVIRPRRVSPNDLAAAFEKTLGTPVRAELVPHEAWEDLFRAQGMKNPRPRIRMLDGFNEGWIVFRDGARGRSRGASALKK